MPDHVHLRLYARPGMPDPVAVGAFVDNFKRWTRWRAKQLGIALAWEPNYYDRLRLSRGIIDQVDKYIALRDQTKDRRSPGGLLFAVRSAYARRRFRRSARPARARAAERPSIGFDFPLAIR